MNKIIAATFLIFCCLSVNAQLKIGEIMHEINQNRDRYSIAGTITVLNHSTSRIPTSSHLNVLIEKTELTYQRGRNYIQANTTGTFRQLFGDRENEIRIYIHRSSNTSSKEDLESVKINWKRKSGELIGVLTNIKTYYERKGILITGSFQKENQSFGISLAISQ